MLRTVPWMLQSSWARVNASIGEKTVQAPKDSEELDTACKWWALKALLFLRRENKKLRDTLAQRFKLWESGDYKGLVDLFVKACAPRPLPRPHNDSEPLRQRRALRLF